MTEVPPSAESPREEQPSPRPIEVKAEPYEPTRESARTVDAPPAGSPAPTPPPPPRSSGPRPEPAAPLGGFKSPETPPPPPPPASGPGPESPPPPPPSSAFSSSPARRYSGRAALCHALTLIDFGFPWLMVGWVVALIMWFAWRDKDAELDYHGRESLNFQLNILFWALLSLPLTCCVIGPFLAVLLVVAKWVLVLVAALRAADGERFRYPLIYRVLK